MLDVFVAVFFALLGILALIYGVEIGVFVGLALFPWQIIKIKKNKNLSLIIIALCSISGITFLAIRQQWLFLLFFVFLQVYNYWGAINVVKEESNISNEE